MLKRRLKEPFGKAGLTVAIFALVLAMVGGAYAAGALSGKQKKEVEKIAKKFAGKPGAAGAPGAPGTPGAAGKNGTNGTNGGAGANGKSVTVTEIEEGEAGECEETGGAMVKQEGSGSGVEVCNGEKGKEGSPWTAGGTLPKGSTETGTWYFPPSANPEPQVPISFPIPLAHEVFLTDEFITEEEGPTAGCPGSAREPKAKEGFLCVYPSWLEGGEAPFAYIALKSSATSGTGSESPTGGNLVFAHATPTTEALGTFAVTAP
ncbi:MAG: hypothetical protein JWM24_2173 [Solirubrobacterales bacterium]|nr:hypothetical protein [Solirubrobacterales bacterium]